MKHFILLILSIVILTPMSSFAQQKLRKDGSYLWRDASNSMLKEALNFSTDTKGASFVAISYQDDFETTTYNSIDNKIVFTVNSDENTEKKYTCILKNDKLQVEISQTESTVVTTRTYTFVEMVNAAPPSVPELMPVEIEEEEEGLELEPD
jgi:hypothetical protein